jgi:hypothetical protein
MYEEWDDVEALLRDNLVQKLVFDTRMDVPPGIRDALWYPVSMRLVPS